MKVEGRCHCGAIEYEGDAEPGTLSICNCADCQMQSGSAFRVNVSVSAESFRITKGMPKKYVKTADSGAKRIHAFCENCGGPVYASAVDNPQVFSLRVGALRQRHELGRPARQIWTSRRLKWMPAIPGATEAVGQP